VATALPDTVPQSDVRDLAAGLYPHLVGTALLDVFDNARIQRRSLCLPVEAYATPAPTDERYATLADWANRLGTDAANAALAAAEVAPGDVDTLVVSATTVTRSPALDATLIDSIGLSPRVRRVPLAGMASLGGASALAVGADLVRAGAGCVLVVVSEVNSLTFVPGDDSPEAIVSMALFSDGAAAVVLRPAGSGPTRVGDRDTGTLSVVASHGEVVPESLWVMGLDAAETGLVWHLAREVPDVAGAHLGPSVDAVLTRAGWTLPDVDHFVVHPGGVRVLETVMDAVGIDEARLEASFGVLGDVGNVSGATVLAVLERHLAAHGATGRTLLSALGPGFGFEHVALHGG
jgi:alkylresorcinol/alkylpyrone synthase